MGVGAGASRLVSGTMTIHRRLEERLAEFKGREAALLFGSGYLANTGAIVGARAPRRRVFSDELNHASIIDGCRSRAPRSSSTTTATSSTSAGESARPRAAAR